MSEESELKPDPGAPVSPKAIPDGTGAPRPKRHLFRRILTWVLVVLFAVMTPLALTSAWAVKTLTNTQRYVDTMQPLVKDPVIQEAVAKRATNVLFEKINVQQRISTSVPAVGKFIAAPLTAELKTFANKEILKLVSSTWFANLWEKENRYTQQQALAVLTGKPSPQVSTAKNLIVNLTPSLIKAIDELDQRGVTVFNPLKSHLEGTRTLTLKLVNDKQVKQVQTFFKIAVDARTAILILTPLLGIAAIAVAVRRRRAAFRVLLAGAIGCLVLAFGLTLAKQAFITSVPAESQLAAQHIFDTLIRYLRDTLHWAIVLFVIGAIIMWIVGDTSWAIATRRAVVGGSKQIGGAVDEARKSETAARVVAWIVAAGRYVGRTPVPFRWIGAIVAAIFVLISRTAAGLWWTIILLALYQGGIVLLERWVKQPGSAELVQGESHEPLPSGAPGPSDS